MNSGNIILIVAILGLVLLQFVLRRRKPETLHREIAQSLLMEVRLNQALAEGFHLRQKPRRFEVTTWQRNKTRLDFLAQSLQAALSDAFMMVEDFNRQIEAAKKYRSATYTANVDIGKLREPLDKSKEGLEEWLLANVGRKEPPMSYPGIFDSLFGGGRRG